MVNNEIVQKLWNLCNVLRDDGITYHEYVTELTFILFLKIANEKNLEDKIGIPSVFRWKELSKMEGLDLSLNYRKALLEFSQKEGNLGKIYHGAQTKIEEPKNLKKIFSEIDKLDWFSMDKESMGDLYEGLLEKNASEKKSGAGQYFTPRVLIESMVRMINPQVGEKIYDPAGGTLGFLISADRYLRDNNDNYESLEPSDFTFQKKDAFTAMELVNDTHRLALMNAILHDIDGEIRQGDTLSSNGKDLKNFDVILSNPPFGTKKGGERATRDDITHTTSNKQLNFLQVIYNSLNKKGNGRAAVVLPDNVLFQDGDGQEVRKDLLNKCNLHTILRLPTGIFYAQGVKTNVLFFTRGKNDQDNTKEVQFYDLRTNMVNFGKNTQLKPEHFAEFEANFDKPWEEKEKIERWSKFTIEEIKAKNYSLDLGLIRDDSQVDHDDLPSPVESAEEAIGKLEEAVDLLKSVIKELHLCGVNE